MLALSDQQLDVVMRAARSIRLEDRDQFLRLVADQLRINDNDVHNATKRAVSYLQDEGIRQARMAQAKRA